MPVVVPEAAAPEEVPEAAAPEEVQEAAAPEEVPVAVAAVVAETAILHPRPQIKTVLRANIN